MNDDFKQDDTNDVDPGEPVAELADLQVEPAASFSRRIIRRIDTKIFGSQLVDLGTRGLREFFISYWNVLASLLGRDDKLNRDNTHE